ncbi:MAG: MlaE family ABC transporter permease [Desulfatiglandales bacterium]
MIREYQNSTNRSPLAIEADERLRGITVEILPPIDSSQLKIADSMLNEIKKKRPKKVIFHLKDSSQLPSSFTFLLGYYVFLFEKNGTEVGYEGLEASLRTTIDGAKKYWETKRNTGLRFELIEGVGDKLLMAMVGAVKALTFVGELLIAFLKTPWKLNRAHKGALSGSLIRVGIGGVPIVCLISLLLGLVMAFMSSIQLEQFGAQIYVASLLTLAMTRELGPIMTGILIAGRSGSSFASELGTMKLSEEVDALRSMGFDIIRLLVMPKMLASAISLPILSLFSQFSGILGGLLVAVTIMGITPESYWNNCFESLRLFDIWWGTLKCITFGLLIGGIGCYEGLRVEKGAASVGEAATKAVVKGIFAVILFDSIFAILLVYW